MKKTLQRKTVYEPNVGVKVTVANKPIVNPDTGEQLGFDAAVSIAIKRPGQTQELKFSTAEDIAKFIETVDFEEPQQALEFAGAGDQS